MVNLHWGEKHSEEKRQENIKATPRFTEGTNRIVAPADISQSFTLKLHSNQNDIPGN